MRSCKDRDPVCVRLFKPTIDARYVGVSQWVRFQQEVYNRMVELDLLDRAVSTESSARRIAMPEALVESKMVTIPVFAFQVTDLLVFVDPPAELQPTKEGQNEARPQWGIARAQGGFGLYLQLYSRKTHIIFNGDSDSASKTERDSTATPISPVATVPDGVTTSSLQALQSEDQRKVIDIVDKLRRTSLSGIVELPQLVVCGDQPSGKSSVLEAITEMLFPRKENLCTRFTTEIILCRSPSSTISITSTLDKLRPKLKQTKLKEFSKSIKDFRQLPDIIEEATAAIGLGTVGGINSRAFCRDVLSVPMDGPDRPQLTLVDPPGLIRSTNKAQTETDKQLILDLVKDYIDNG